MTMQTSNIMTMMRPDSLWPRWCRIRYQSEDLDIFKSGTYAVDLLLPPEVWPPPEGETVQLLGLPGGPNTFTRVDDGSVSDDPVEGYAVEGYLEVVVGESAGISALPPNEVRP